MSQQTGRATYAVGLLALALTACAPPAAQPAAAPVRQAAPASAPTTAVSAQAPAPAALEKIVVSTSDPGIVFSPLYVGIARGFFREEGLEPDVQVIKPDVSLAALANDQDVAYQATIGTVSRGAANGLPVKAISFWFEKTLFYLMARPEIQSVQDLKGQVVGVPTLGGSGELALRRMLTEAGLEPQVDVSIIQLAPGNGRIGAIVAGGAAASVFTPPDDAVAEEQGLHRVPSPSEAIPLPFSGIGTSEKRLQENPGQVERVLRASLKTLRFMRDNHQETAQIIAGATDIQPDVALRAFESMAATLSPDGWASPEALQGQLESAVTPGEPLPSDAQVFDSRPLKAAQQSLGIAGRP
ncbi:MAG TPA: ABC transporter substrate-binding protein [Chloroflexota bacterium]|nr:ABC transporter substrate-binding protein [Chloroflexota bacterium]